MPNTPVEVNKATPARANLVEPWQSFRTEMDRLFDRISGGFGFPSFGRLFDADRSFPTSSVPAVDISEDDKAFKIAAELPGLEEKDVDVTVTGDMLVLKGEKKQEKEEKDKNYYLSERAYGMFQRSFALPQSVDRDKITASFAKGVLTVMLPKTATARDQQKKIDVKAA
jgi:HSP20 family protein